jgi:hypothetical protein
VYGVTPSRADELAPARGLHGDPGHLRRLGLEYLQDLRPGARVLDREKGRRPVRGRERLVPREYDRGQVGEIRLPLPRVEHQEPAVRRAGHGDVRGVVVRGARLRRAVPRCDDEADLRRVDRRGLAPAVRGKELHEMVRSS